MQSAEKDVLIGFVGGGDKEGDAAVIGMKVHCAESKLVWSLMYCREGAM